MSDAAHEREGGSTPVRCRGCHRPWPCPDAVLLPLKPYTRYICPDDTGQGHSTLYTGALNPAVRMTRDGYCTCGERQVEEVDDGTRWRLSWEMDTGAGWHPVVKETSSERDARSQAEGLERLAAEGELIRNVRLERAHADWEAVDA
jgi:hypothetical protein